MELLLSVLYLALHLVYVALLARLVLDWIQMFARNWRPRGAALVAASVVYTITDPPMKLLRRLVPPLRFGGIALDLGFLILIFAISIIRSIVRTMLV
ncbi:YggT family protein [Kocuria dechangensis]|uniref:YggT family protein n=1 Tax=Kocuria dechangensis TaxID=1176249 RepID=A0A917H038_9MICC|nr:YggT family protein [Kocuria dechangensis]GGG63204.1 YggT family protein [Kocuria dechangensis]